MCEAVKCDETIGKHRVTHSTLPRLIVVFTITMAVGTKYTSKRNVIVRNLDSLGALGAVTNICSDKTGMQDILSPSL